ncbi:MAG TPA: A24 family peptidase [Nitrososphaerales archaeon]|nr:A24 family peptidase [Nitrososphaerales archaeon]
MYSEILICASLVIAAWQDFRKRSVYDIVWIPGAAGVAYALYASYPFVAGILLKVGLVGVICLVFTYFGAIGEADAIALVLVAADPTPYSPVLPLIGTGLVAGVHISFEYINGNARGRKTIPLQQFKDEQRWIPRAIIVGGNRTDVSNDVNEAREEVEAKAGPESLVEVTYGVPTVAYLGVGYAAYLVVLVLTNPHLFASLP